MLTILSVAYPLAPVGPDAVGGAEQVLAQIDRALVGAGHRSLVIACEGSEVTGRLIPVPGTAGDLSPERLDDARRRHREAIGRALRHWPVDVVHMHGIDFHHYLPPPGAPVLASLHGPVEWYGPAALRPARPRTWIHAVSQWQHRALRAGPWLLPPIENGVPVEELDLRLTKRRFALMLARIAPEKGIHLALDAARAAGLPLLLGGQVFGYAEHLRYFEQEVRPRLDGRRRLLGPLGFRRKRRFLAAARCVVISSPAGETSSLVAREALAAGTPVVALDRGALGEVIEHGRTGFLVDDLPGMAEAMRAAGGLDPEACRQTARLRFSLDRMVRSYFAVYCALASQARIRQADVHSKAKRQDAAGTG